MKNILKIFLGILLICSTVYAAQLKDTKIDGRVYVGSSSASTAIQDNALVVDGNVGVGSTNPSQKIDVAGTVKATTFVGALTGNASTATALVANGGNCTAGSYPLGVDASGAVEDCTVAGAAAGGWTDGGTNVYVTTTTDNVGIGTTQPGGKLIISSPQVTDLFRVEDNGAGDTSPFLIDFAGNVGIGTASPQNLFTLGSTGQFQISSSGVITNASGALTDNTVVDADLAITESINLPVYSAKLTGAFVVQTPTGGDASTQGAQIDAGDGNWRLLFPETTDAAAVWQWKLPDYWAAHGDFNIYYSMTSATADEVEFELAIMCQGSNTGVDVGTASFAAVAVVSETVDATLGDIHKVVITPTDDSCAAGNMIWFYLSTDANDAANDDATGNREVVAVEYEYTR